MTVDVRDMIMLMEGDFDNFTMLDSGFSASNQSWGNWSETIIVGGDFHTSNSPPFSEAISVCDTVWNGFDVAFGCPPEGFLSVGVLC